MAETAQMHVPEHPQPAVSVVIVSWNTRALLHECLASLADAGRELNRPVEIIVVDNASSDDSVQMVKNEFPAVRVMANGSNIGFAAATNQGIRESRGRHLLLLNPDTTATGGFLRELVSFLEQHPSAGAVGPRLLGSDGEHQVSCFLLPTLSRELWRLLHLDRLHQFATYPLSFFHSEKPKRVEAIQGACMLLRREAIDQAGLLDETFFMYTEEIDLCRRLLGKGWEIYWVPRSVIVHYGAASTSQVGGRMFLELYRSKIQYFRKHLGRRGALEYKAVLLIATLPRLAGTLTLMALVPSRRPTLRGFLKNYSALLIQLPAL